jgi:hypothetical protein
MAASAGDGHDGCVMPLHLALRLRDAGLSWQPSPGDRFAIPHRGMDDEVFVLSTMTIDVHDLPGRTVIGFNGTTEWALDDVEKDATIWLPREDQLRELLGGAFHRLERAGAGYQVVATVQDEIVGFTAADVETAYAEAVLHLLASRPIAPHSWS